jgi:hypothetical protein
MEKYTLQIAVPLYLLLTTCVLFLSVKRRINIFKALLICIVFTPIGGFLAILSAPQKATVTHYKIEIDQQNESAANPKLRQIKKSKL